MKEIEIGRRPNIALANGKLAGGRFDALLNPRQMVLTIIVKYSAIPNQPATMFLRLDSTRRPVMIKKDVGIVDIASNHSVDKTVEKIRAILEAKGVTLFALVDHSGEAEKVGMTMPATKLLIFGSPKAGTPVMLAAPSAAIDLPLKLLVWEDCGGKAWISYNSLAYLQERHGLPQALMPNLAALETIAAKAAE